MKFLKKNKWVVICICFVLLVILGYRGYTLFFYNASMPEYGDRLVDLKKHQIGNKELSDMKTKLTSNGNIEKVDYNIRGKILNVVLTVSDAVSVEDAKKLADEIINDFSSNQMSYYDVQVYIKNSDTTKTNYPIIGYKQAKNKAFTWTKDR